MEQSSVLMENPPLVLHLILSWKKCDHDSGERSDHFDYSGLKIVFASLCDDSFTDTLSFTVHFIEPCSPLTSARAADWVQIPSSGDVRNITLTDYDENDADLELIRVQYRRSQGNGAWINIADVLKADLGPDFEIVPWNTRLAGRWL